MKSTLASLALLSTMLAPLSVSAHEATAKQSEQAITFTARSGEEVAAMKGTLSVLENRADPESRMVELSYVRFASTNPSASDNPGVPIVYLSGGPGGSGSRTATGDRFSLFMDMRQHGDVIAFDQRGTGGSTQLPPCKAEQKVSNTVAINDAQLTQANRHAARECAIFWRAEGVDIAGYTTRDSVHDLSALRRHLGADRLSLWSISYGSHLAMAALNEVPDEIDRVIIASAEGLDQTVKLPAQTDAYFARLQAAVDQDPAAKAAYPDIAAMMRRVHARLEAEPIMLELQSRDGTQYPYLLQRRDIQRLGSGLIADPANAAVLLALYASLDRGETNLITKVLPFVASPEEAITLQAMNTAMDLASGISDDRLALVKAQRETALLGDYLNFPMPQLLGVWDGFGLDDSFRNGPFGETPVLLLSGTLDGRTYPEEQSAALAGMTNVTTITVEHAGHNLFMTSPEVGEAMHRFMRDEAPASDTITLDLPDLMALPGWAGG